MASTSVAHGVYLVDFQSMDVKRGCNVFEVITQPTGGPGIEKPVHCRA